MTITVALLSFISSLGAIGVALTLLKAHAIPKPMEEVLGERLQPFEDTQAPLTLEEAELSMPFGQRVFKPFLERMGKKLTRGDRSDGASKTAAALIAAGNPHGLTEAGFNALTILSLVFVGGISCLLVLAVAGSSMLIVGVMLGGSLGLVWPRMWLARKGKHRMDEIQQSLPSVCDLLTISVEAGLSLEAALHRVSERYPNALGKEIDVALRSIQLGTPRPEAFLGIAERCGVEDVSTLIRAMNHSQEMGTGLGRMLRVYSEELRRKRRERAEQKGQQAPLKMLFPMVGCIFPTLFIVLLGPAILQITSH